MTIEILDEAENDIANAMSFYEVQKENLGEYFLDSIMSDIEFYTFTQQFIYKYTDTAGCCQKDLSFS